MRLNVKVQYIFKKLRIGAKNREADEGADRSTGRNRARERKHGLRAWEVRRGHEAVHVGNQQLDIGPEVWCQPPDGRRWGSTRLHLRFKPKAETEMLIVNIKTKHR